VTPVLLPRSTRPNPAAEHSADLVYDRLKRSVFLHVERSRFLHQSYEESESIKLHARSVEERHFALGLGVSSFEQELENINDEVLASLVNTEPVRFRD